MPWGYVVLISKNSTTWAIIGDAFGVLFYSVAADEFGYAFHAEGLDGSTDYSLIYYADPWPGDSGSIRIDSGMSDADGVLSLGGSVDLAGNLPDPADENSDGAKVWLVLSDDYDGTEMTDWNPTEYLFESYLITYTDTSP